VTQILRAWRSSNHGKLSFSSSSPVSGSVWAFILSASQQTSIRNFIVSPHVVGSPALLVYDETAGLKSTFRHALPAFVAICTE
jgi:hypothetical protein